MKRIRSLLLFALVLLFFFSCKKEKEQVPPDTGSEVKPYLQYGTPFKNIPETQDIVMYEVNLRAFSASGDLQGVIDKLNHIEALGVNVLWLMPIHPIGQVKSVNSPYSVKDYKAVSSEYGTLNDLRKLTDEAHKRGIAVIMDWVANHTAWDNKWTENRSWYTQDGNGNIVHPPGTNWQDVADLNYGNADMQKAMIDAMRYWVYEANVDGFRCDYADGVPFDFWRTAWQTLDTIPNRKFIYFAEGTRNDHFTAGFQLNFGWQFYGAVKEVFKGQPVSRLLTAHQNEYSSLPAGKHWVRFTTNHDESAWDATPISLFNGIDGALAASVVTIFYGGVPLIYGSQEVGTANKVPFFSKSTINWNANPTMLETYKGILQFYARSETARRGMNSVYPHNDVACFKKSYNGKEILIIANLRNANINFSVPAGLTNSTWKDVMATGNVTLQTQLALKPYQYFILEQ